jgi:hypothetical protein
VGLTGRLLALEDARLEDLLSFTGGSGMVTDTTKRSPPRVMRFP